MKPLDDLLDRADALQRRWPPAAFAVAVWKKFSDDRARDLAALIAFYAFIAIFPLLLVLVTVLDLVLLHDPALRQKLLDSALTAYPVIGTQIKNSVQPLTGTGLALAAGLIGALYGARGVARAMQNAFNCVWAVPLDRRPAFPASALRSIGLIVVIGLGQILTASLSSLAVGAGHLVIGILAEVGTIALALVVNIGVFWLVLRLATAAEVSWSALRLGAILSAVSWQALQLLGTLIVGHTLRHSSELYGVFSVVLGLLVWLYLQAQVTLCAVEACTVREWRLWPRSLRPPLTQQDVRAYERYGRAERRLPADSTSAGSTSADSSAADSALADRWAARGSGKRHRPGLITGRLWLPPAQA
jgi:YihY family inner membrane protein